MNYKKERYLLAKKEGRHIKVKNLPYELRENTEDEVSNVFCENSIEFTNMYFDLIERTENIVICTMTAYAPFNKIEISTYSDGEHFFPKKKNKIAPYFMVAIPTKDNEDFVVQKNGSMFTKIYFPSLRGWFVEMVNVRNSKSNTKSSYSELWFCFRKNKTKREW